MKLVQRVLSHGLLIAIIVAAFFAYTKREELFPQLLVKTEKQVQQTADQEPSNTVQPYQSVPDEQDDDDDARQVTDPLSATGAPAPVDTSDSPGDAQQTLSDTGDSAPGQVPGRIADTPDDIVDDEIDDKSPESPGVAESISQGGLQETEVSEVSDTPVQTTESTATSEAALAAVQSGGNDQVTVSTQQSLSQSDVDLERQLEVARQHYWQRDLRSAAEAYRTLSETYPKNPDVWGEMGNLYFNLRQREPASAAYSRCIELLIEQGEEVRARQMLNVLYQLGAPGARELEARMQQAGS
jgi:tetratricopeptide (TPR) repeat protein